MFDYGRFRIAGCSGCVDIIEFVCKKITNRLLLKFKNLRYEIILTDILALMIWSFGTRFFNFGFQIFTFKIYIIYIIIIKDEEL